MISRICLVNIHYHTVTSSFLGIPCLFANTPFVTGELEDAVFKTQQILKSR